MTNFNNLIFSFVSGIYFVLSIKCFFDEDIKIAIINFVICIFLLYLAIKSNGENND